MADGGRYHRDDRPRGCRPLAVMEAGRPRVHVLMALQGLDTFEQGLVLGPRGSCAHRVEESGHVTGAHLR
jgi:hypothetical protein